MLYLQSTSNWQEPRPAEAFDNGGGFGIKFDTSELIAAHYFRPPESLFRVISEY